MSEHQAEHEQRVTPLELFFDLVFVFGFTQVTTLLSDDPTWSGLGHGFLILAALWWAWAAFAWLTNTVDPDVGAVWGTMLVAIAAMFVAALAVPDTFGRHGVVFGVAFLIVDVMFLALYALAARGDHDLLAAILRIAPMALGGAALIFFGPLLTDMSGWRVQPAHFVERHGLIVIIAIGESLVAIGLGARGAALGTGVIVAAVLALVVVASFWLAYFDFFPIRGQQMLVDRSGTQRTTLARDVYTYLHLPMVAGIVLFAFAMRPTLAHVGDKLDTIPAFALCCGSALYLFAYVALRWRVSRTFGRGRLVAGVACVLLWLTDSVFRDLPRGMGVMLFACCALTLTEQGVETCILTGGWLPLIIIGAFAYKLMDRVARA